jgi:hypothetical protein
MTSPEQSRDDEASHRTPDIVVSYKGLSLRITSDMPEIPPERTVSIEVDVPPGQHPAITSSRAVLAALNGLRLAGDLGEIQHPGSPVESDADPSES